VWEGLVTNGNLDLLQWLAERCPLDPTDSQYCYLAAKYGQVETLQWLQAQGCVWNVQTVCDIAEERDHWAIVHWVVTQGQGRPHELRNRDVSTPFHYTQRQELLALGYNVTWERNVYRWLEAITNISRDVLGVVLCSDLVTLIQRYC